MKCYSLDVRTTFPFPRQLKCFTMMILVVQSTSLCRYLSIIPDQIVCTRTLRAWFWYSYDTERPNQGSLLIWPAKSTIPSLAMRIYLCGVGDTLISQIMPEAESFSTGTIKRLDRLCQLRRYQEQSTAINVNLHNNTESIHLSYQVSYQNFFMVQNVLQSRMKRRPRPSAKRCLLCGHHTYSSWWSYIKCRGAQEVFMFFVAEKLLWHLSTSATR